MTLAEKMQPLYRKKGAQPRMMMMQLLVVELVEAEEHRLEPRATTGH
jgi:hypothetical protein